MYFPCQTDACPSFLFPLLALLSTNCLQTPNKMFLFFSLLSSSLDLLLHLPFFPPLRSVFLGFPPLLNVSFSNILLSLSHSSSYPLIFSTLLLLQVLYSWQSLNSQECFICESITSLFAIHQGPPQCFKPF